MNLIKDIVTGNDGSYSLVKVAVLLVIVAVLVEHVYMVIHTGQEIPLDWTQIAALLGALSAGIAHAVQDDKPTIPPSVPPATTGPRA